MNKINRESEIEEKLTDFTDRVLAGKSGQPDPNADEELRQLEDTILSLKRSLPRTEPDKAVLQQLGSRLMGRLQQEEEPSAVPFWRKWLGGNGRHATFRPQVTVLISFLALAVLALIGTFLFPVSGSSMVASTEANTRIAIAVMALTGLIVVWVWIHRRR